MKFGVTILGSSAALPTASRNHSAHVLNVHEQFYLVDCGEGTQQQLMRVGVSPMKIACIFITHLHGDHVFGLFPLLSTMGMLGRRKPLRVFAPRPFDEILEMHRLYFDMKLPFEVLYTAVDTRESEVVYENKVLEVVTVPLRHGVPTVGYFFREKANNHHQPRSYAYISDTNFSAKAAGIVNGVDLLYHEATFADQERALAKKTGHSTTLQAAKFAQMCGAKRLIIGHFSARYKDLDPLLIQTKTVFENSFLALDGGYFELEILK